MYVALGFPHSSLVRKQDVAVIFTHPVFNDYFNFECTYRIVYDSYFNQTLFKKTIRKNDSLFCRL